MQNNLERSKNYDDSILITIAFAVGASVWYLKERTKEPFILASCLWGGLVLIFIKTAALLILGLGVMLVILLLIYKPELLERFMKMADVRIESIISKVKGDKSA